MNTAVEQTELMYDQFPYALRGTAEYRFFDKLRVEGQRRKPIRAIRQELFMVNLCWFGTTVVAAANDVNG